MHETICVMMKTDLEQTKRHQQDLNLRSQRETDDQTKFESVALTTRP